MLKLTMIAMLLVLIAAGCVAPPPVTPSQPGAEQVEQANVDQPVAVTAETSAADTPAVLAGAGYGRESGMMERHHADVPAEYADLVNTAPVDEDSLQRGQMIYAAQCATCHGATGMGDGPAGQALDPAPAPIAHTSQMLSDGYLYWRISEGGHSFETAMPAWSETLSEQARWDVINYMRSLESDIAPGQGMAYGQGMGGMGRGQGMGQGQMFQRQAGMLNAAVAAGLISQEDASFFQQTQQTLGERYAAGRQGQGRLIEQTVASGQAVADGIISQADADRYQEIHDLLMRAQ